MIKKAILLCAAALLFSVAGPAQAANAPQNQDIPEKNGVYDVPGHPNLKVRVFVHEAKPNFGKKANVLPSCTDPESSAIVKSAGWKLPQGTWSYYVNSDSAPSTIGTTGLNTLVNASFAEWKDGTDLSATFADAGKTDKTTYDLDQHNIITWGTASSNALAVTYTWYYRKTKMAVETDTIMNKKFSWSWTPYYFESCGVSGTYDAQNILTHELGHWVGLNDHYTAAYANNTMYGYGSSGEIKKDTLTTGDVDGVARIY